MRYWHVYTTALFLSVEYVMLCCKNSQVTVPFWWDDTGQQIWLYKMYVVLMSSIPPLHIITLRTYDSTSCCVQSED